MYSLGRGVAQDSAREREWYTKAAMQGHPAAQFQLDYIYASGRGVAPDAVEAFKWYRLAAAQTSDPETRTAASKAQSEPTAHMSAAEKVAGQQLAREWKPALSAR